jgi:hypothetical protein
VLRALVAALVSVDVAEVPRLAREDEVTATSAVHFLTGVDPLVPAPPPGLVLGAKTGRVLATGKAVMGSAFTIDYQSLPFLFWSRLHYQSLDTVGCVSST